jgi:hypothetical protein
MLWDFMEKQKLKGTIQLSVPKKDGQPQRLTQVRQICPKKCKK